MSGQAPRATPEASVAHGTLAATDPISAIPGVGVARGAIYAKLGVVTVLDLLRLAPRRFEDRRTTTEAARLAPGPPATWIGVVASVKTVRTRGGFVLVEAVGEDETGRVHARWWNQPWIARSAPTGSRVLWHGVVEVAGARTSFTSPAVERVPDDVSAPHPGVGRLVPVHPATTGLSALAIRRAVWAALDRLGAVDDPMPESVREGVGAESALPPLTEALRALHFPDDLASSERARERFAFDELLVHELVLARRRRERETSEGIPLRFTAVLDRRIRRRFPFALTPGQDRAVADIARDLSRATPMNRLLQGDVGSGKTAVAAYACLAAIANGHQAAFMAPTELLARQHEATLSVLLAGSKVRVVSLLGAARGKARKEALARIAAGAADLVVGTHAILSKPVAFARLGLVVVDEQHKFGVRQRRTLVTKGAAPHCLVMTATPIPRTLAMVVFGDLDLSILEGRPPGAVDRETIVAKPSDAAAVADLVRAAVARGRQAFVIYPLVEESDHVGLRDATEGESTWRAAVPAARVGLVHGRMKSADRTATMDAFRRREIDVLVATVVVEVGIDVPNATVLVVEHAERFGLSQLHQLRGRIGRGTEKGTCVLVDRSESGTPDRLRVMAETEDGFRIAEEDLRLRGAGDLFGTRQHGAPTFSSARLPADLPILERARRAALAIVATDASLSGRGFERLREWVLAKESEASATAAGG